MHGTGPRVCTHACKATRVFSRVYIAQGAISGTGTFVAYATNTFVAPGYILLQWTLTQAYSGIVGFKIWAGDASTGNSTNFQNVSVYLSSSATWRAGLLCASGVNAPTEGRYAFNVMCNSTITDAMYITFVRYIGTGATAKSLLVNEIQPLRMGE